MQLIQQVVARRPLGKEEAGQRRVGRSQHLPADPDTTVRRESRLCLLTFEESPYAKQNFGVHGKRDLTSLGILLAGVIDAE
jgi:hypothetical protein